METNGIKRNVVKGGLIVDSISKSQFQKEGTLTAMLRQKIITTSEYPSARVSSDKQDNLFGDAEFGFESQKFDSEENRVAFMDVPDSATVASVTEKLKGATSACLYKVLDNQPILTDLQLAGMNAGLATLDTYANSQVTRYPEGHPQAGQIIKDKSGKVQYRSVFFSLTAKEDIDNRKADADYGYVSPEITAELANAPAVSATMVPSQSLS